MDHRKKWTQMYVRLQTGANLVFYKDSRSAQSKKDGSMAKPEQIVSLAGCRVAKDPHLTTKKYSFVVSTFIQIAVHCNNVCIHFTVPKKKHRYCCSPGLGYIIS